MAGFRFKSSTSTGGVGGGGGGGGGGAGDAAVDAQFATDGRNLSDVTHQDYDPATDPELRLRVTHTIAESIHETILEDDRRRRLRRFVSQSRKKKDHHDGTGGSGLKPRKSLFRRTTLLRNPSSSGNESNLSPSSERGGGDDDPRDTDGDIHEGVDNENRNENPLRDLENTGHHNPHSPDRGNLERQRTQANAAAEAEESAKRQERQDGKKGTKKKGNKGRTGERSEGAGSSSNADAILGGETKKETRVVYVNVEGVKSNPKGFERNKVRTSKYTMLTFIPKNLGEQFRRVANMYFLLLVVLQVFSIFGAAAPQVAMLPLLAILTITAIKDATEDYRRHSLDNDVNNSAVTRLGDWENVNLPVATRRWWQLFSKSQPTPSNRHTNISKGVRKLREKEGMYDAGFLYSDDNESKAAPNESRESLGASSYTVDFIPHEYPPTTITSMMNRQRSYTLESGLSSRINVSKKPSDVVSYDHPTPGTAKWERTLWKKLEVGDIVLLREDDQIPADMVILSTSDPDGVCFVETKNLDGETNLKPRKSLKATMAIGNEEDVEHAQFWIDSEAPHANLYSYNAVLKYRSKGEQIGREHPVIEGRELLKEEEKQEPVTINELLLRGCALRNTKWVIALIVFTGADTKIMLNQGETPSKRSKIEKETNFNVLVNFGILMLLCIGSAVGDFFFDRVTKSSADFFEIGAQVSSTAALNALVTFGATLILFQNIVPISLVITVELVKTIQAFFIYQDLDMYYEPLDHPCLPKTWNISDDLGQIEYVFSDKTGTLTQNIMEFQKCAVAGVAYGEGITEAMMGAAKREGRDTSSVDQEQDIGRIAERKQLMISTMKANHKNRYLQEDKLTLIAPALATDLNKRDEQQRKLIDFWTALAICHTVLADRSDSSKPDYIDYKAESPDEAALVGAARDVGFVFIKRSNAEIEIEVLGQTERYIPLRVLAFNSSRKRMSTLVRTPDNRILLICKGADSVIYQRLREDHDPEVIASTTRHLDDFANAGLRTLCISSKYISEEEFSRWSKLYDQACAAIEDREVMIEQACELIEHDLTILGATALEDKLQEGVPEAIAQLHKAGLKLWILTGDKLQTAIEIAYSCNLLSNSMEIMILSSDTEEGTRSQIEAGLTKIYRERSGLTPLAEKETKSAGFAVVIDGETLRYALDDGLKAMFLELTTNCDTVVCCRVSPSQKALTVKLVKDGKNAMTLAIGDGANDVAMIQEAHIGVGIAGLEGAQASMSADYAVGQFRYLTKLLLVHGRWCYIRIADMHATFFYKNIVWTLTLFYYQIYCNFDGTCLYDYSLIMLFNLVFTSLPVAVLGIFDKDVSASTSMAVPQLYRRGIAGVEWTRSKFFFFMGDALYQSIIAFFIPYLVYSMSTTLSVSGHDFSVWEFGTTVAACAVTAANLFVGMHIRYWTWMTFVVIIGSTLAFHIWIMIYSQFDTFTFENELTYLYSTLNFWTSLVFVQIAAIGPKFVYKYIQSAYYPHDSDIVREMEVTGSFRRGGVYLEEDLDVEEGAGGVGGMTGKRSSIAYDVRNSPDDIGEAHSPPALMDLYSDQVHVSGSEEGVHSSSSSSSHHHPLAFAPSTASLGWDDSDNSRASSSRGMATSPKQARLISPLASPLMEGHSSSLDSIWKASSVHGSALASVPSPVAVPQITIQPDTPRESFASDVGVGMNLSDYTSEGGVSFNSAAATTSTSSPTVPSHSSSDFNSHSRLGSDSNTQEEDERDWNGIAL